MKKKGREKQREKDFERRQKEQEKECADKDKWIEKSRVPQ